MKPVLLALAPLVLALGGCHPGPIVGKTPTPADSGTIAGIVSTTSKAPVPGRRIVATNTESGEQFEATTGVNGGYTLKVPLGRYRLQIQLREGEQVTQQPGETRVNRSDLDPRRDFVLAVVQ